MENIKRILSYTRRAIDDYEMIKAGDKIAVGADLSGGMVAIKGWREVSAESGDEFFARMQKLGVKGIICTDISKDGLLGGTNIELYRDLSAKFSKLPVSWGLRAIGYSR